MLPIQSCQWQGIADRGCSNKQISQFDQSVLRSEGFVDDNGSVNAGIIDGEDFNILCEQVVITLLHLGSDSDPDFEGSNGRDTEAILIA